jgi:ATP-binding cassette subfamily B protein
MTLPGRRSAWRDVREALAISLQAAPGVLCLHILTSVATGIVPVAVAWLTKLVMNRIVAGQPVFGLAILLASAGVLATVVTLGGKHLSEELGRRVSLLTKDRLYTATGRMTGLTRLEDPAFQDRLRMAEQHSQSGPVTIVGGVFSAGRAVLTMAGFVVTLAAWNPVLAGVIVLGAVPALFAEIRLSRQRMAMLHRLSPRERRQFFYSQLLTGLNAAKEIRLLGLSRLFRHRMLTELGAINREQRRMSLKDVAVQTVLGLLSAAVSGAGLCWAILAASRGELGVGDVAVFVAAVAGVQGGLRDLVLQIALVHNALLRFGHYQEVLGAEPDLAAPAGTVPVRPLARGIELRDVWFRYGDDHPWVLRGVDLFIPCGQSMALVGRNGAGKSTLVKLLCRFYDPTKGSVHWDGIDIRELPVMELRRRIGAVFQDFMCYELSAWENIGLGDTDGALELDPAARPRIEAAARRAGIHETLESLPRGYQTMLSRMFFDEGDNADPETGVLLSGGQWQRVALARGFLRNNRDLLVLDEPTAGLDAQAEHDIHMSIAAHRTGHTSVLISHRLGAIRDADQIAVLVDGRVAELGTHAELVSQRGTYAALFAVQASGYTDTARLPGW